MTLATKNVTDFSIGDDMSEALNKPALKIPDRIPAENLDGQTNRSSLRGGLRFVDFLSCRLGVGPLLRYASDCARCDLDHRIDRLGAVATVDVSPLGLEVAATGTSCPHVEIQTPAIG